MILFDNFILREGETWDDDDLFFSPLETLKSHIPVARTPQDQKGKCVTNDSIWFFERFDPVQKLPDGILWSLITEWWVKKSKIKNFVMIDILAPLWAESAFSRSFVAAFFH